MAQAIAVTPTNPAEGATVVISAAAFLSAIPSGTGSEIKVNGRSSALTITENPAAILAALNA